MEIDRSKRSSHGGEGDGRRETERGCVCACACVTLEETGTGGANQTYSDHWRPSAVWRYFASFLRDQHQHRLASWHCDWGHQGKHHQPPWGTAGYTSSVAAAGSDQDQAASGGSDPVGRHCMAVLQDCRSHREPSTWLNAPEGREQPEEKQGRLRKGPRGAGDQPDQEVWLSSKHVNDDPAAVKSRSCGVPRLWGATVNQIGRGSLNKSGTPGREEQKE